MYEPFCASLISADPRGDACPLMALMISLLGFPANFVSWTWMSKHAHVLEHPRPMIPHATHSPPSQILNRDEDKERATSACALTVGGWQAAVREDGSGRVMCSLCRRVLQIKASSEPPQKRQRTTENGTRRRVCPSFLLRSRYLVMDSFACATLDTLTVRRTRACSAHIHYNMCAGVLPTHSHSRGFQRARDVAQASVGARQGRPTTSRSIAHTARGYSRGDPNRYGVSCALDRLPLLLLPPLTRRSFLFLPPFTLDFSLTLRSPSVT